MRQIEIQSIPVALGLSEQAIGGATLLGAALPLTRNTAAAITADRNAMSNADNLYEIAKTALANERAARDTVLVTGRKFTLLTRDVLKPHLGNSHSASWTAAGFNTSITVPRTALAVSYVAGKLEDYLTQYPALENEALDITAVQAGATATMLVNAHNAVNTRKVAVMSAKIVRDQQFLALRKRLRDLVKELSQILSPLDPRWEQFGLNRPGVQVTPPTPENVVAAWLGNGSASVKWDAAARANHYRVWKKVVGVDADYLSASSPADPDFLLENLPANAQVEIQISAVNTGGESARSEKVTFVTA